MNTDAIIKIKKNRLVSQTTGLICAKCGAATKVSNREESAAIQVEVYQGLACVFFLPVVSVARITNWLSIDYRNNHYI